VLGPTRATPPALDLEDLPPLDAILLSHNHYDHMDLATLSKLARLRPCPVWTPLGNDAILKRHERRIDARALDWGQSAEVGALRVMLEPALHWSARGLGDRRMALWGSFMIAGASGRIFFAGDSGFGDGALFHGLAARHSGPLRFAMLPIGAYAPRWFMREQHCDPDEAVAIFSALGAQQAAACHWGTFQLTTEPYDEPPRRLAAALAQAGIAPERFVAPPPGGVVEIA
jgi:L-ascorbate metabolism protein UlaG (beta-lactamase superfamily)